MKRIESKQRRATRGASNPVIVVEVLLAGRSIAFQSSNNLILAFGQLGLAGIFLIESDHQLIGRVSAAETLDDSTLQARVAQGTMNLAFISGVGKTQIDLGAAR